jgi:hypothetical protein
MAVVTIPENPCGKSLSERPAFTPNRGFNPITSTSNGTTKSSGKLRTKKRSKLIRNCE